MGLVPARRPGWLLEAARERRPRGMVAYPASRVDRTRLTDPLTFSFAVGGSGDVEAEAA